MSADNGTSAEHHTVLVIGAGFSGIGAAIKLREAGISDVVLLERASDIGGAWRDNTYPGCCCDIPSHVYSYSFALNPHWTRGFSPQPEIHAYLKRTAERFGVLPLVRLQHEVLSARWDDAAQRWQVETTRGAFTAKYLIAAGGALSDPTTPDIPGLDSFAGTTFHSAQWNHEHDLTGRNVAVIGTGASAIQFVPAIQPKVGKLTVFQRTPPWVIPRMDHQITGIEHLLLRIPFTARLVRTVLYWLLELRFIGFRNPKLMQRADKAARAHLARQVKDAVLLAKLTPGYIMGCKRILISDDYYPAITQPNVELVTDPIAEVRPHAVVTRSGAQHDVDTIIFGTGFHVVDAPIAERIVGADGRSLAEHWRGSMQAYLGTTVAGFPNFFFMLGPNTGLGHNSMIYMLESQLSYVVDAIRQLEARGFTTFRVRPEVQRSYDAWVQQQMQGTVWTSGGCQSWYLDDTGRNPTLWPSWTFRYAKRTRSFDPQSYELTR